MIVIIIIIIDVFARKNIQSMDKLLYRIYNNFEGAGRETVDWRDVVCSLLIIREYKQIRDNVAPLLEMLFDIYADLTNKESIAVIDLERIFR